MDIRKDKEKRFIEEYSKLFIVNEDVGYKKKEFAKLVIQSSYVQTTLALRTLGKLGLRIDRMDDLMSLTCEQILSDNVNLPMPTFVVQYLVKALKWNAMAIKKSEERYPGMPKARRIRSEDVLASVEQHKESSVDELFYPGTNEQIESIESDELYAYILKLPKEQGWCVLLRMSRKTWESVAKILGITVGQARGLHKRARKNIRKMLEEENRS